MFCAQKEYFLFLSHQMRPYPHVYISNFRETSPKMQESKREEFLSPELYDKEKILENKNLLFIGKLQILLLYTLT